MDLTKELCNPMDVARIRNFVDVYTLRDLDYKDLFADAASQVDVQMGKSSVGKSRNWKWTFYLKHLNQILCNCVTNERLQNLRRNWRG